MRILIVTPSSKLNGTAKTFLTWIKSLYEQGHKIILYTNKGNLATWTKNLCERQYYFELARFEPSFFRIVEIIKIVRKERIDNIWGVGTTSSLLGSLVGIICKKNYLNILNVSPREHVWPVNPNWRYPSVGHIVTVSEHYRELLINESKMPREYCHFVPAQFDLDELKPAFDKIPKTINKKIIVSLFRRFDKQKTLGVEVFLKFVEEYRNSLTHCKFNLYGGGDSEMQVNEFVKTLNELGVDITNHGFIKEVQNEMVNSDIVVGSERVAIESLLCGRPVCIIGDNGIVDFVTEENLEAFMSDNFSGLGISNRYSITPEEALDLFSDYKKLLSKSNPQYCYGELVKKYDARIGVQELICLSEIANSTDERGRKFLRVLRAIISMYSTKIRIALANRLDTL